MENLAAFKDIFSLENKVAIVSGGYGHLGKGMVLALLSQGAHVIIAGKSEAKFSSNMSGVENEKLSFHEMDITDSESIRSCLFSTEKKFGKIDVLINNAHSTRGNSPENMTDSDWAYTIEANAGSVHKTIREVLPIMKRFKSGKIINIASMYGLVSPDFNIYEGAGCEKYTNPPHYGAAKAAIIQLTKYYGAYLGKYNIQVNAIAPGPFPKDEVQEENPEFIARLSEKNPMKRIGRPIDLAGVTLLLSSRASDFITGQVIQVDGGWTIW